MRDSKRHVGHTTTRESISPLCQNSNRINLTILRFKTKTVVKQIFFYIVGGFLLAMILTFDL